MFHTMEMLFFNRLKLNVQTSSEFMVGGYPASSMSTDLRGCLRGRQAGPAVVAGETAEEEAVGDGGWARPGWGSSTAMG